MEGSGVERPLELSYDELRALPSVTLPHTIVCALPGHREAGMVGTNTAAP